MATDTVGERPADGVDLAKQPSPTVPSDVQVGERLGTYGGPSSMYVRKLFGEASLLVPGRSITRSWETVRKMRRHYQISACLLVQQLAETGAEWSIECDDDDIREWLTSAYELIDLDVSRSSARALWAGYSPNALVWDYLPDLGGISVVEIRDLPPHTCDAVVDANGSYAGLVQDRSTANLQLPPAMTLWIVEGMESGHLYGRSVLEAAYDPFVDHAAIRAFHARYLERFGEPVVKTRAPAGQTVSNLDAIAAAAAARDAAIADGMSADDAATAYPIPAPAMVDNVTEALRIGENIRHHSVIAFPSTPDVGPDGKVIGYAWDAEYLEAKREAGNEFLDALRETDKRMARAIFIPDTLFQGDTNASTYALGSSHRDIWSASVEDRLKVRARQQSAQLLDPIRTFNFGASSPRARLVYSPQGEDQTERLWAVASQLITDGKLNADGQAIAAELGLPLSDVQPDPTLPPPTPPTPPTPPGNDPTATQDRDRIVIRLGAGDGSIAGLPEWKLPQSYDPPAGRRKPNAREARVGFRQIEDGLNRAEADAISTLTALLERERDRVSRQVAGALRKATAAEIITALGSIELKGQADVARAWRDLMGSVWTLGLDRLREELAAYAERLPTAIGTTGSALVQSYASNAAERVLAQLSTELRAELLNAYTSSVSPAGMASVVSQTFDVYEGNEGKGPRLTTRMLSSKALNTARADAIQRGGIPLKGAQYSAMLDARVCDLCAYLDEMVVSITSLDLDRFTPPLHFNCRCVWVWITEDEADFTETWETPASSTVDKYGGLVF